MLQIMAVRRITLYWRIARLRRLRAVEQGASPVHQGPHPPMNMKKGRRFRRLSLSMPQLQIRHLQPVVEHEVGDQRLDRLIVNPVQRQIAVATRCSTSNDISWC